MRDLQLATFGWNSSSSVEFAAKLSVAASSLSEMSNKDECDFTGDNCSTKPSSTTEDDIFSSCLSSCIRPTGDCDSGIIVHIIIAKQIAEQALPWRTAS